MPSSPNTREMAEVPRASCAKLFLHEAEDAFASTVGQCHGRLIGGQRFLDLWASEWLLF
jgi:hypothetical protein